MMIKLMGKQPDKLDATLTVHFWTRVCKNVFERDKHSKLDWKSRFYAKSTSAYVPINFRFNVDVRTSILAKRFYTLWAVSGQLCSITAIALFFSISLQAALQ